MLGIGLRNHRIRQESMSTSSIAALFDGNNAFQHESNSNFNMTMKYAYTDDDYTDNNGYTDNGYIDNIDDDYFNPISQVSPYIDDEPYTTYTTETYGYGVGDDDTYSGTFKQKENKDNKKDKKEKKKAKKAKRDHVSNKVNKVNKHDDMVQSFGLNQGCKTIKLNHNTSKVYFGIDVEKETVLFYIYI